MTASKLAENVGMGATVDIVHQGFLNSPGHRTNMVDTGVNSVGVGVAYAGGYVYVVQDYAQLSNTTTPPPPPPNRAPTAPTQLTPANAVTLRSAPSQVSARYSDPDGNTGAVFFLVADDKGQVVRQAWSGVVCSGCVASVAIAGLPDGIYALYTASVDGLLGSPMSAPTVFGIDRTAPVAPVGLQRAGGHAFVVYSDPDGSAGWVYVYLYGPGGALLTHGRTPKVCSGCTTAFALPALSPGTYSLYAFSYDGLRSAQRGPCGLHRVTVPFTVCLSRSPCACPVHRVPDSSTV